jgi:hypothetical protein
MNATKITVHNGDGNSAELEWSEKLGRTGRKVPSNMSMTLTPREASTTYLEA